MWEWKALRASMAAGVACAAFLAALPSGARAQRPALELSVNPDAQGCVDETALRAHLDRFLRVHRPIDVEVVVHAGATPVGFELRHDGAITAERRFDVLPTGCRARLDALALAIAVAVENAVGPERASLERNAIESDATDSAASGPSVPDAAAVAAAEPAREAESAPAASPTPPAQPAAPAADASPATPSAPRELTIAPFVGAGLLLEVLLEPAFALHAGSELRLGPLVSVSVAGLFAPGRDVDVGRGRASSSLLGGRALGCLGSEPRGLRFEGCAGAAAGAVFASGEEGDALEKPGNPTVGWLAGVLRAAASFPADGTLGARLAVDGHLNLVRPGLRVEGTAPVERVVEHVGLAASLELWFALR